MVNCHLVVIDTSYRESWSLSEESTLMNIFWKSLKKH